MTAVRGTSVPGAARVRRLDTSVTIAFVLAVLLGFLIARGYLMLTGFALVVAACWTVGLIRWKVSFYALLAFMPFSGIAILATFPHTSVAVLLKDILFVGPAYAGFLLDRLRTGRPFTWRGSPLVLFVFFAVLVLIEALNPSQTNKLAALIGVKVWLFYIPLYFLAYFVVRTRADLFRLLTVMSVAALLPALFGVIEALLIYGGKSSLVYGWYGNAAAAVSQGFTEFEIGGGSLRRVSSTFSFWIQYYDFVGTMIAVTYAWWRSRVTPKSRSWFGLALWLLMVAATFFSGARAAFLTIPFLLLAIFLLEGRSLKGRALALARMVAPAAVLVLVLFATGISVASIFHDLVRKTGIDLKGLFVHGFSQAFSKTLIGLGSGVDTAGARYAYAGQHFPGINGFWYESWYVKVVFELGVIGLVLVVAIFGTITVQAFRAHRALRDPRLRVVSAALIAFLLWNLVSAVKQQYLDFDPLNVYFWLLLGVLARLPKLDAAEIKETHS